MEVWCNTGAEGDSESTFGNAENPTEDLDISPLEAALNTNEGPVSATDEETFKLHAHKLTSTLNVPTTEQAREGHEGASQAPAFPPQTVAKPNLQLIAFRAEPLAATNDRVSGLEHGLNSI
jgi:hypothetical protein